MCNNSIQYILFCRKNKGITELVCFFLDSVFFTKLFLTQQNPTLSRALQFLQTLFVVFDFALIAFFVVVHQWFRVELCFVGHHSEVDNCKFSCRSNYSLWTTRRCAYPPIKIPQRALVGTQTQSCHSKYLSGILVLCTKYAVVFLFLNTTADNFTARNFGVGRQAEPGNKMFLVFETA